MDEVRPTRSRWPRLLGEADAAEYLSIGTTMLRDKGPAPKRDPERLGRRVLYDIKDLDRWADLLAGQPLDSKDEQAEAAEATRRWLEKRKHGRG